ncbi:hypothetical protein VF14_03290 [Nostoc linckia z18]|jgi:hypothetical protein|uniref:Uncharacterized protein n=2 Tax=Nostoc linckia TaxID=92942 RepID=A0A9Q5ZGM2_NOSLI|nr:hypothetical protein [Nostoc linckia]PHK42402.1 hypothetical protein VF12_03305 [Nostoc linckia z15]PHK46910.1 hypothetical protein VF13_07930 [Nostoc linckia z16]PHJ69172.1 hypothetical protein VF02_00760 [Nostoc linckia z1]PHJ73323.1 hypothetical protein VF05_01775 [Nostoc linckia z3]PHJ78670.1 hypothetical protein VF03_00760 [Nostoc linckia z2]
MENNTLIQVAQMPGWNLNISPKSLSLEAPSRAAAEDFLELITSSLGNAAAAFGFRYGHLTYPNCRKPYKIPASIYCAKSYDLHRGNFMNNSTPLIVVPGLQITEMKLSLPILRIFEEFCEYPERRSGLVRVSDERQVAMSESSAGLVVNATLKQAVQRKRDEYWHPDDLGAFNREWQQNLSVDDNSSTLEFSYRGVSADGTSWRRFTNRYRLVKDSYGILYHVSSNVGVEEISRPAGITV